MIWSKQSIRFVLGIYLTLSLVSCGFLKSAPSNATKQEGQASSDEAEGMVNTLSSISVEDRGEVTGIVISGSKEISPNIFKLTDPHRIIIDLTDTSLGEVDGPIQVGSAGINDITVSQFDDASSSLSRIVIGLDEALEYQVESEGNQLVLNVNKVAGASMEVSEAGLPETPEDLETDVELVEDAPVEAPVEAETPLEDIPLAEADIDLEEEEVVDFDIAEEEAPALDSATATPAPEFVDVQYFSADSGTTVRMVTNGTVEEFEELVLENPNRLVVDLKNFKNAYVGDKTIPLGTSEVDRVRVGGDANKVRVVLDLAGDGQPSYNIERDENALVVMVTDLGGGSSNNMASDAGMGGPEIDMATDTMTPIVEEDSTPSVTVTGLGFKQLRSEGKSRIVVSLTGSNPSYEVIEKSPSAFTLEIQNSQVERSVLRREFNTREFETAILSIGAEAVPSSNSSRVQVELEQAVAYRVVPAGNELHIDVDIPQALLRQKVAEAPKAEPQETELPPLVEEDSSAAESVETGIGLPGERKEFIVEKELPSIDEERQEVAAPKDYRYVQEGFMSDTSATGDPLSAMGSILAGSFQGRKFTGRKISLDFKDADIRSIFRLLADISKLNMIISDEVKGRVTVRLENVPWDQAFAIILQTKSLWFEKFGNIVRIAPAEKLRAEKELAAAAARAAQAAKPLDVLFKPVSYATASALTKQVKSVLSDRGTVDIDSRTNTLIIKDIRENLEKAKTMVEILDTQTPQVTIESRIVEANTNFTRSFGIIWGGQARFEAATGNPTGVFFPNNVGFEGLSGAGTSFSGLPVALNFPSPLGVNSGVGIRLGSINNIIDLDLALGVLETQGHAKLISSPKITVMDNEAASIQAGSKIPFLTQTANAGSNVRFESATTSLAVTPQITNDGSISMQITATRNEPNFAQLVQGNPLVDQRTASTKVLVKSGNTTVLGGIYSIRTGTTRDSLPGVSKIPIIGWLFRNWAKELRRTELLIFVTPRIVGDEREAVRDVRG